MSAPVRAEDLVPPRWLNDNATVYAPVRQGGERFWLRCRVERAHGDAARVVNERRGFSALLTLDDLRVPIDTPYAR